jgi:hypothetical protein
LKVNTPLVNPNFGFGIHTTDFVYLATDITEQLFKDRVLQPGEYTLTIETPSFPFLPGVYSVRFGVDAGEIARNIFYEENIIHFQVKTESAERTQSMSEGIVSLGCNWLLSNN